MLHLSRFLPGFVVMGRVSSLPLMLDSLPPNRKSKFFQPPDARTTAGTEPQNDSLFRSR